MVTLQDVDIYRNLLLMSSLFHCGLFILKKHFSFRYWMHSVLEPPTEHPADEPVWPPLSSEFDRYVEKPALVVDENLSFNPIEWWVNCKSMFPTLYLYALDFLCCPAMSTECERVFSGAKKTISEERNRLGAEVIEAGECLKAWWKRKIVD
jgi:hypothetical protein